MDHIYNNVSPQAQTKKIIHGLNNSNEARNEWLNDADEILSNIDHTPMAKERFWPTMGTALTLLKQAKNIISSSEKRIQQQAARIATLEKLSNTDELTEILNRRGFMFEIERELDRVNRDKSQGGLLIMIDLDNFKNINDTHGHDAGDAALKLVAETLSNDIRRMDVAGRMGGDEFVILFVNTDRKQALERAQFLIKKLNNLSFIWHGEEIPVRASIGLQDYNKGSQADKIFRAADQSMYDNKRQLKAANTRQDNKIM